MGWSGAQWVIVAAGHLGLFFLLTSDGPWFLPKRLGVPEVRGQIRKLTALAVGSVLEYRLWLQGVPGRSPGAKCIVFVSNIHVWNASGVCFEGKDLNKKVTLVTLVTLVTWVTLTLVTLGSKISRFFLSAHWS